MQLELVRVRLTTRGEDSLLAWDYLIVVDKDVDGQTISTIANPQLHSIFAFNPLDVVQIKIVGRAALAEYAVNLLEMVPYKIMFRNQPQCVDEE